MLERCGGANDLMMVMNAMKMRLTVEFLVITRRLARNLDTLTFCFLCMTSHIYCL